MAGGSLTMTKRMFLKLAPCSWESRSLLPCFPVSEGARWGGGGERSGDADELGRQLPLQYREGVPGPLDRTGPGTRQAHSKLKVLGTRHCFNGIADSTANLIVHREMDQLVALDPGRAP